MLRNSFNRSEESQDCSMDRRYETLQGFQHEVEKKCFQTRRGQGRTAMILLNLKSFPPLLPLLLLPLLPFVYPELPPQKLP